MNKATDKQRLMTLLFQTKALQMSPADQPFWYTSGKFGPYYINTHFLLRDAAAAEQILGVIENEAQMPLTLAPRVLQAIRQQIERDPAATLEQTIELLSALAPKHGFDLISGGERRDFFFSLPLAEKLARPHLTLFKDGRAVWHDAVGRPGRIVDSDSLDGLRVLHVADLVTEASSYFRSWLPAIARGGAAISRTLAVVDRDQGGREALADQGIELQTLIRIDRDFFDQARAAGLIDEAQHHLVQIFCAQPDQYMKTFLTLHPDFIERELAAGGQRAERAARCRERGFA